MTVIIKSNNAFGGAASLSEITEVTHSAQDLYDAYAARVVADGGAVQDAAACLAAFTAAVNGNYLHKLAFAISARWGRKVSGTDITKFYTLYGDVDGIVTNTVALNTVKETWAVAEFNNVADLITFTGLNVNKAGTFGYVGSTGDHTSINNGLYATFTPAAQQWIYGEYDALVSANAVTMIDADFAIADNQAVGVLVEQDQTRFTIFADGLKREVAVTPFTALADNATATFVLRANAVTVYMNEFWVFNNATEAAIEACCFDVGARY